MTNPELRAEWLVDVKTMADRIIPVSTQLGEGLTAHGNNNGRRGDNVSCFHFPGFPNWQHFTDRCSLPLHTAGSKLLSRVWRWRLYTMLLSPGLVVKARLLSSKKMRKGGTDQEQEVVTDLS